MKKSVKIIISLITAFVIAIIYSASTFADTCKDIRNDVFRLHILANSDSYEDQQLKIAVRDYILSQTSGKLNLSSKEQAIAWASDNLDYLAYLAKSEIIRQGYDYDVRISIEDTYFTTRQYEELTLPAGIYTALRIEIGEAAGKNWWCVLFPQLCIPSASSEDAADNFSDEELEIVGNGEKYKVGFWLVEIFEELKQ